MSTYIIIPSAAFVEIDNVASMTVPANGSFVKVPGQSQVYTRYLMGFLSKVIDILLIFSSRFVILCGVALASIIPEMNLPYSFATNF
jgi:hypothetical protein